MPKHFLMVSDLKLNISHLKYDFFISINGIWIVQDTRSQKPHGHHQWLNSLSRSPDTISSQHHGPFSISLSDSISCPLFSLPLA